MIEECVKQTRNIFFTLESLAIRDIMNSCDWSSHDTLPETFDHKVTLQLFLNP